MDSCFVRIGARQHCVAKICNTSQRANAHKLQNDPFTISSCVPCTHLHPETRVATSCVAGRKKTKVSQLVSRKAKEKEINVAEQSQPKHLKPHGQYHRKRSFIHQQGGNRQFPIYSILKKWSRDMSRGQNKMLRQGRTLSFIIREKFSLVKQNKRSSCPTIILLYVHSWPRPKLAEIIPQLSHILSLPSMSWHDV